MEERKITTEGNLLPLCLHTAIMRQITHGGKGHKTKNDQSKKSQLSLVNLKKKKNRFVLLYSEYNIVLIHAHAHTSECM